MSDWRVFSIMPSSESNPSWAKGWSDSGHVCGWRWLIRDGCSHKASICSERSSCSQNSPCQREAVVCHNVKHHPLHSDAPESPAKSVSYVENIQGTTRWPYARRPESRVPTMQHGRKLQSHRDPILVTRVLSPKSPGKCWWRSLSSQRSGPLTTRSPTWTHVSKLQSNWSLTQDTVKGFGKVVNTKTFGVCYSNTISVLQHVTYLPFPCEIY